MNISSQRSQKVPVWIWIIALTAAVSISLYVESSRRTQAIGFPLDDAWIHQTYARNLADLGEWSFIPGAPSAGSTSPLWTIFLSLLHFLSNETPFILTFLLGGLCLWGLAVLGEWIFRKETDLKTRIPLAGMFIAMEWHLVWAGASGMETLLTAVIILAVFALLLQGTHKGVIFAGLITGIGLWVRPDTITLAGPLIFCIFFRETDWKERLKIGLQSFGAGLIPVLGYLGFNFILSGQVWPNTFYAKQAEYASMQDISLFIRIGKLLLLPLVGAGALLVPGFIFKIVDAIRNKDAIWVSAVLWWLGYNLIYALRLPVTYQHGRYLMPAMPVFFIVGLTGSFGLIKKFNFKKGLGWVLQKGWLLSSIVVLIVFLGMGANAYARDVAIINTEMVEAAKWIENNTATDDLIAVHDIGAVGYFGQRNILDLAGLVTPEVIPIIRNEEELALFLDNKKADFLMTFPGWYPSLTSDRPVLYRSKGVFSIESGGENMVIYRWEQE